MAATKHEQIRVSTQVKNNLSVLKRDRSFNDYIAIMIQYFAVTNIAPESCQVHPFIDISKRLESIVKIMKGIEKSKLDPMYDLLKIKNKSSAELLNQENLIPLEQAQAIIEDHTTLEETVERQNTEIEQLKKELSKVEKNNPEIKKEVNKQAVNEVCDLILEKSTTDNFRKGYVSISKNDLVAYLERIKEEVNI